MLPGISPIMLGAVNDTGVPSPVDWPDINSVGGPGSTGLLLINGFSSPILLRAEVSDTILDKGGNLWTSEGGSLVLADGAMIDTVINPNTMFGFDVTAKPRGSVEGKVTVKYRSPGSTSFDATLDEFLFNVTGVDIGGLE